MLCGRTAAVLYMFHLVVVNMDTEPLTETVEQKPIKMLINNAKKECCNCVACVFQKKEFNYVSAVMNAWTISTLVLFKND